jgi:hypothetical protein
MDPILGKEEEDYRKVKNQQMFAFHIVLLR